MSDYDEQEFSFDRLELAEIIDDVRNGKIGKPLDNNGNCTYHFYCSILLGNDKPPCPKDKNYSNCLTAMTNYLNSKIESVLIDEA